MPYLDEALLHDEPALLGGEGVLEPVPQEERHRHRLVQLVRAGAAAGSVNTWKNVLKMLMLD